MGLRVAADDAGHWIEGDTADVAPTHAFDYLDWQWQPARAVEGDHFRRRSSKRNDRLQGGRQLWVRRAGSTLESLRPRL